MSNEELLVKLYPRLYHMGHAECWPSVERHGLLSTTALLDLFDIRGDRRTELEQRVRRKSEQISHPVHGRALLRDQKPLNEKKLMGALQDGMEPDEWYRLLNRRVFFWGPASRLVVLQEAKEYRGTRQTIIVVDCAELLKRHGGKVSLCYMNSGATQPIARPRGKATFLPIADYPLAERFEKYGAKGAVAEVTVDYAVPDVREFVVEVFEVGGDDGRKTLLA